jgi:hypothetical protein
MNQYPLPISCHVTVQTLITEHPVVIPLLERFGISTTERTGRDLIDASRAACVAKAKLCDSLAATIEVDRIADCWWP